MLQAASTAVGDEHRRRSSLESLFCYDKAIPEEIIEKLVGSSLFEKNIGHNPRCTDCHAKGAVLCVTCSGSGLYVDSILESQGIIVKVRCLGKLLFSVAFDMLTCDHFIMLAIDAFYSLSDMPYTDFVLTNYCFNDFLGKFHGMKVDAVCYRSTKPEDVMVVLISRLQSLQHVLSIVEIRTDLVGMQLAGWRWHNGQRGWTNVLDVCQGPKIFFLQNWDVMQNMTFVRMCSFYGSQSYLVMGNKAVVELETFSVQNAAVEVILDLPK
ncbi:hypothetical protein RJ639_040535, partial [Escallonia herrerae]